MLEFESLTLKHKDLFAKIHPDPEYCGCEYEFSAAFIWNIRKEAIVCVYNDVLILSGRFYSHPVFYPPMPLSGGADLTGSVEEIHKYCEKAERKFIIKALTDKMLSRIGTGLLNRFKVIPDRDLYDYIYDAQELINLPTPKFHDKKNHLNQFMLNYRFDYRAYRDGDLEDILSLFDGWAETNPDKAGAEAERRALINALKHLKAIDMFADVIIIDGRVRAFAVGSVSRSNGTGIVNFEKADIHYKGIYAAVNNFFAKTHFSNCKYVNRQEDMGFPGLRRSKMSYNPVFLLEKSLLTNDK